MYDLESALEAEIAAIEASLGTCFTFFYAIKNEQSDRHRFNL